MADEENMEVEEELDIDSLMDEVAAGGPAGEEGADDDAVDIDSMLDEVAGDEESMDEVAEDPLPADEMVDEAAADEMVTDEDDFDIDALVDDNQQEDEAQEPDPVEEELMAEPEPVPEPEPAPTPAPEPAPAPAAPAAAPASIDTSAMEALLAKLTTTADRVESAVSKAEEINAQLEERHTAAEKFVKGVKDASKEMKEERPSLAKVEKASSIGMIVAGVGVALTAAVLGLVVTEDKETLPEKVETVSASVDGVGENVNLIAGRIFEQQQMMDEAVASMTSLQDALNKIPEPAPEAEESPMMEEDGEMAEQEMAEVTVDFSIVEGKIDETQQKIMALHEQLKNSEGQYPELKRHLEELVMGQEQLKQEQFKLIAIQQSLAEEQERVQSIYKFP